MNKNVLLLVAAAAAYAALRPKTTTLIQTGGGSTATGAASYVPATTSPAPTTTTTKPGGWAGTVGTVVAGATTAVGLIKTGSSLWDDIKDAFHIGSSSAPAQADVTADQSGSIWAGPKYEIS